MVTSGDTRTSITADGAETQAFVPSTEPESQPHQPSPETNMDTSSLLRTRKSRRSRIFTPSLVEASTSTCCHNTPNLDAETIVKRRKPKTAVTLDLPQELMNGMNEDRKNVDVSVDEASTCSMSTHEYTVVSQNDANSVRSSHTVTSVSRVRRISCSQRRAALPQGPLLHIVTESLWSTQSQIVVQAMNEIIKLINRDEDRRLQIRWTNKSDDDDDNATNDESIKLEFIWLGGHLAVLRAMQNHSNCCDIQIRGSRILFKVLKSISVYWMSLLGCMGTIRILVVAMHKFNDNLIVQESCSRTLYRLLSCQANAEEFCGMSSLAITGTADGEDGVTALLRRVEQFPQDRQTRIDVCNLLKKLCAFENVRRDLHERGVVYIVPSGEGSKVQASSDDQSAVSSSKTSITSTTTASMSDDSEGSDSASDLNGQNAESASRIGVQGLPVVIEHEEALMDSLCITICHGPAIRKLVETKPGSRNYWHRRRFPAASPSSQDMVVDDPRIISLIEAVAIDLLDDDWEVAESALEQMDVLIHQRYDRRYSCGKILIEIGGPLALLQAMKSHQSNASAQWLACNVMQSMNRLEGMYVLFSDLNTVNVMLDGLRANPNESKLQKAILRALLALLKKSSSMSDSYDSKNSMQQFFQADGIAVLLQAICGFPKKAHIQIASCKLLTFCVKSQPLQFTVNQDSVVATLETILENHDHHSKAANAATRVLEALERKTSKLWI